MLKHIALISTGGTIEKTYDELAGILHNRFSVLDVMLSQLQLRGVAIERLSLMNKDSLQMSEADHELIVATTARLAATHHGIVIVHGTDRLAKTGHCLVEHLGEPRVPIVLTGAMKPWEVRSTDAMQNLTEALLAVQLLHSGVYVCMHNHVLQFPGVEKDPGQGTFVKRT
jgi:L-asparaginase